jgi:uncharacterized protein
VNSGLPPYLFIPLVAWLVAQSTKVILALVRKESDAASKFFASGNMPSAHSAVMIALLTVIGAQQGLYSPLFGVVTILTAIILYDALNVRRAVGEQGRILKQLAGADKPFFSADGHRLTEVVVGAVIGVLTAVILLQIL